MAEIAIRPAREDDLERLAEIHAACYPDDRGQPAHARALTHNAFGGLECIRVAERRGEIVAHAALFDLATWLGGRRVSLGGIGSLAVAPEARRCGVARVMIDALHAEMAENGAALSFLYPFRQRFYAKYDYAAVSPLVTLRIDVAAIEGMPSTFEPVRIDDAMVTQVRQLYDEVAQASAGHVARTEARWEKLLARETEHWIGIVSSDLRSYARYSYELDRGAKHPTLVVHELVARDAEAKRALLVALGMQRDQVLDVELTMPYGDSLVLAYEDIAGPRRGTESLQHPLGTLCAGPMVRWVDLRRALAARGYAADGELTLRCVRGEQSEAVRLVVRNGVARVEEGRGEDPIAISPATLASIVAAGMRPTEALELGLLQGSPSAVKLADDMFGGPRFQCLDPF